MSVRPKLAGLLLWLGSLAAAGAHAATAASPSGGSQAPEALGASRTRDVAANPGPTATQTPTPSPTLGEAGQYGVEFDARIMPSEDAAHVSMHIQGPKKVVLSMVFRIDPARHLDFRGDGTIDVAGDRVTWIPGSANATLRYRVLIDHLRDERSYDARIADTWALFRGDDLFPAAHVKTDPAIADSKATLRMRVPDGWSVVTPYKRLDDGTFRVDRPERQFDRPVGWMVMGELGVVREKVAGVHVSIAGPRRQKQRRQDLLAMLRWTLPTARKVFRKLPRRLAVVGAGDPMWRGGLSGPGSLYVHADRPLIGSDGTSPIVHELVHTIMHARSGPGGDWVVEGLAELYSIELLMRSHTTSKERYEHILERIRKKGHDVKRLRVDHADGVVTARAVIALRELDALMVKRTEGTADLDDVVRELTASPEPITTESLQEVAERVAGVDLSAFFSRPELRPLKGDTSATGPTPEIEDGLPPRTPRPKASPGSSSKR